MDEYKIKELICDIGKRVYRNGFVAANDGNITVKLSEDEYLTTPTGISKGYLTPEMIVKVYEERKDVGAVVHAHPPFATTLAVAHIPMDFYILPEAVCGLGAVPLVPYAQPSTQELADGLVPYLQDYDAFLLENHGTVTVGTDLINAYYKTETLEYNAKIYYLTKLFGVQHELPLDEIQKLVNMARNGNSAGRNPGYIIFHTKEDEA